MDSAKWNSIYKTRITPTSEIETNKTLLTYNDAEMFCEGTISMICGAAKSRKTFAMSLLLEQMITPVESGFKSNFEGDILYFDTEMSPRRVQEVSKRFTHPEIITFMSIRQYSIKERYQIIEEGIKRIRPKLVVIDGYKELTLDINDQVYSTMLIDKILQWTAEFNCHITGVLHTNPGSDKPRGALGTELSNKCSSVMRVESNDHRSRISSLFNRDKEFSAIYFSIDDNGIPRVGPRHE